MNLTTSYFKNELPFNWRQQLATSLFEKGILLSPQQISDLLRGRNKNQDLIREVLLHIKLLRRITLKKKREINKLKN